PWQASSSELSCRRSVGDPAAGLGVGGALVARAAMGTQDRVGVDRAAPTGADLEVEVVDRRVAGAADPADDLTGPNAGPDAEIGCEVGEVGVEVGGAVVGGEPP